MRGRKPKPTTLKKLAGNPGKRKLNDAEPVAPKGIPTIPAHLDKEARSEWERVSKFLDEMGLMSQVDMAALAIYCQAWSRMVSAEKRLKKKGMIFTAPSGYPCISPNLGIINNCVKVIQKIMTEFGMSPASRARIRVPEGTKQTGMDEFMNDGGG